MSFLSKLFGSRSPSTGPGDVERQLAKLEEEATRANPGYVGTAYNRAGDLASRADQEGRALGYWGQAIDAFLEDGQREAARGVANKIIRVRPTAVRTLCTLTWLDLAARHQATALLHLRDYAAAAREQNQRVRAASQIYEMASLSDAAEFLDAAADALDGLDFANRANEVRGWTSDGAPAAVADDDELADACLAAAVKSKDEQELLSDVLGDRSGSESGEEAGAQLAAEEDGGRKPRDGPAGSEEVAGHHSSGGSREHRKGKSKKH